MTKKEITFAKAFKELEDLTQWFETEEVDLDDGIVKFERGLELAQVCKKKLTDVENKVQSLKKKFDSLDTNNE